MLGLAGSRWVLSCGIAELALDLREVAELPGWTRKPTEDVNDGARRTRATSVAHQPRAITRKRRAVEVEAQRARFLVGRSGGHGSRHRCLPGREALVCCETPYPAVKAACPSHVAH